MRRKIEVEQRCDRHPRIDPLGSSVQPESIRGTVSPEKGLGDCFVKILLGIDHNKIPIEDGDGDVLCILHTGRDEQIADVSPCGK
jgi:hypothetical protein